MKDIFQNVDDISYENENHKDNNINSSPIHQTKTSEQKLLNKQAKPTQTNILKAKKQHFSSKKLGEKFKINTDDSEKTLLYRTSSEERIKPKSKNFTQDQLPIITEESERNKNNLLLKKQNIK